MQVTESVISEILGYQSSRAGRCVAALPAYYRYLDILEEIYSVGPRYMVTVSLST